MERVSAAFKRDCGGGGGGGEVDGAGDWSWLREKKEKRVKRERKTTKEAILLDCVSVCNCA